MKLTVEDRIELDRLRDMAEHLAEPFATAQEAHNFMLNEIFGPCLQQAKAENCFPSERAFIEQSRALWWEVFSHAVARKESA